MRRAVVFFSVFALVACTYQSVGPAFSGLVRPATDEAVVYLIRENHAFAGAVWPGVYFDEQKVADIKNGTYTTIYATPGTYRISTKMDARFGLSAEWSSDTTIRVEAGKLYFVQLYRDLQEKRGARVFGNTVVPSNSTKIARQELRVLPEADAQERLRGLRFEGAIAPNVRPAVRD